jgi:hypothetical protein
MNKITKADILKGLQKLEMNYQTDYPEEKIDTMADMWLEHFKDEKPEWYFGAIDDCIDNLILYQHRLPTVAEIKSYLSPTRYLTDYTNMTPEEMQRHLES